MNRHSLWNRLLSAGGRPEPGLTATLLAELARPDAAEPPPPFAVRRFHRLPSLSYDGSAGHTGVPAERTFGADVDQTNHSVVVGERVVVKWLAEPAPLPHPGLELLAHLSDAGFRETARPYAALTRADGPRETLLALVTGYLPGAADGWEWCVADAVTGSTAFAPALGTLTADLHLALATFPPADADDPAAPPADAVNPSGTAESSGTAERYALRTAARAAGALDEALALTEGEDGRWLAARATALRRELAALADPIGTPLIRIHGDLHVGQILRWRDGYAVIDFDGNPTVPDAEPGQPAARDLAQLLTSLEHVAQVAVKRRGLAPDRAAAWARRARELLAAAYRDRLAGRGRPELLDGSLIRPFEVEQECRELIYAARHLPRWRYAPMGVLHTWYPEEIV